MNIDDNVIKLLTRINPELEKVGEKYAKEIVDSKIKSEFNYNKKVDISWYENYKHKIGIYYFEIKFNSISTNRKYNKIDEYLEKEWGLSDRGANPSIIKDRVDKHDIKNNIWIPFYIGKSKDLKTRLGQHINFTAKNKKTSALRLNEIENGIFKDADYRVRFIELDRYNGDDKYWVVGRIESIIRNKINPICGKQ